MGSNDLHRFWECEMDVGHAVNIQRIHLESCMRHSSCYDKTLANTSGLRSKNTDLASRYFFCGPERCRICIRMQYVRFRNVQHPETRTRDGVHCTPPGSGSVTGCDTPRAQCAHPVGGPPKTGVFAKTPKTPFLGARPGI